MSDKIEPALSADEWAYALDDDVRAALAFEVSICGAVNVRRLQSR